MEKVFEALEKIKEEFCCDPAYYRLNSEFEILYQALNDLKDIKESEPSKAMECLKNLRKSANTFCQHMPEQCELNKKYADTINQALLKAQELEKENAEYKEVLRIIFEKNIDLNEIRTLNTYENYQARMNYKYGNSIEWDNEVTINYLKLLTEEEFDLLKRYLNGK